MTDQALTCSHGVPFAECPDRDAHHEYPQPSRCFSADERRKAAEKIAVAKLVRDRAHSENTATPSHSDGGEH